MAKKKTEENDIATIIINRPEKLKPVRKTAEWSITAFGWVLWFFLCRPLFVALLWFLGIETFYIHMVRLQGFRSVIVFFESYIFIILFVFLLALSWNLYNQIRFGRSNKRKVSPEVRSEELDQCFQMKEGGAAKLQTWKEIQIDISADYHLEFHQVGDESPPLEGQYRVVRYKHLRAKK